MKGSKRDDTALLNGVMEKIPNKYMAVIVASKRARALNEGARPTIKSRAAKPITVAMEEIAAGTIVVGQPNPELAEPEAKEKELELVLPPDSDDQEIEDDQDSVAETEDDSEDDSVEEEK